MMWLLSSFECVSHFGLMPFKIISIQYSSAKFQAFKEFCKQHEIFKRNILNFFGLHYCQGRGWGRGLMKVCTVMTLSFRTDRSGQTVQTQIRLLLEEQSDQGLHCLLFHFHHFDKIPLRLASLFEF